MYGASHDLWKVNLDEEHLESGRAITREQLQGMEQQQPLVPQAIPAIAIKYPTGPAVQSKGTSVASRPDAWLEKAASE
jgi:hypothetical protein